MIARGGQGAEKAINMETNCLRSLLSRRGKQREGSTGGGNKHDAAGFKMIFAAVLCRMASVRTRGKDLNER